MKVAKREASGIGNLSFVVEKVRLLGYAGFWVVVLTGYGITTAFGHVDLEHTLLTEVFGYNNALVANAGGSSPGGAQPPHLSALIGAEAL